MGLGVRSKHLYSFRELSLDLVGILEPVDFAKFSHLHRLGYSSLYEFPNDQDELTFSVLFGPLALCNSYAGCSVGFQHCSIAGLDLLCQFKFQFGTVVEEFGEDEDILEISQVKYDLQVEIERFIQFTGSYEAFETSDYIFPGVHTMSADELVTWFHRCKLTLRANRNEDDTLYQLNEEVLITYPLFTMNHEM